MELIMTPGSSKGFTLVELMIVIALLVILSVIAVPGFNTLVRDNRIQSQAEEFNALLQYARSRL
jgi:type IV fimbrial biogenesis protein FimU